VKSGRRAPEAGPIPLDNEYPLVVPVMAASGGVGRSTVAALLAAALHQQTTDSRGRAVAVCDTRPRAASPWPSWLDHPAEHGTGWLAACAADTQQFGRELRRATSAVDMGDGRPIWVLTDTGPLVPAYSGADPGPWLWAPALRYLRAAVIDGDALEGFRLARQHAGGEPGTAASWMTLPVVRTAGLWVTDTSPGGLSRTLEAMTAAEACGLPMQQVVVVVNDARGHGWASRSRSRRTLLADRVGAIVELPHNPELRRDDRPGFTAEQLAGRELTALVSAVLAAAGRPVAGPARAPAPEPAPAPSPPPAARPASAPPERTPWHAAHPVPAGR
jgi:hypothetical protein